MCILTTSAGKIKDVETFCWLYTSDKEGRKDSAKWQTLRALQMCRYLYECVWEKESCLIILCIKSKALFLSSHTRRIHVRNAVHSSFCL